MRPNSLQNTAIATFKKSRIRETPNLSTDANSSTDNLVFPWLKMLKIRKMQKMQKILKMLKLLKMLKVLKMLKMLKLLKMLQISKNDFFFKC